MKATAFVHLYTKNCSLFFLKQDVKLGHVLRATQ